MERKDRKGRIGKEGKKEGRKGRKKGRKEGRKEGRKDGHLFHCTLDTTVSPARRLPRCRIRSSPTLRRSPRTAGTPAACCRKEGSIPRKGGRKIKDDE